MLGPKVFSLSGEPALQLRRLEGKGPPVLYIHGATFPAALSVGYRFSDGLSWEDALHAEGFDVWSFDFAGFGGSQRFTTASALSKSRAFESCGQVARVVRHIAEVRPGADVSLIAHSWGSIAAGCYLAAKKDSVERLVLFGPIAQRPGRRSGEPDTLTPLRRITVAAQLQRFVQDVPCGEAPVLAEPALTQWGAAYLASDPNAMTREPPAVEVPGGPAADIAAAWQGELAYDPARITVPTLLVRGEWDSLCKDADARFLLDGVSSDVKHDVVIPKATHLMHLERRRFDLWKVVAEFLKGADPDAVLSS